MSSSRTTNEKEVSSSSSMMTTITITLVATSTGQSESLPVQANTTTIQDLMDWSKALFGLHDHAQIRIFRDGIVLSSSSSSSAMTTTLHQAGIRHGDVLAVQVVDEPSAAAAAGTPSRRQNPTSHANGGNYNGGGLLDFGNFLQISAVGRGGGSSGGNAVGAAAAAAGGGGGLDFSNLISSGGAAAASAAAGSSSLTTMTTTTTLPQQQHQQRQGDDTNDGGEDGAHFVYYPGMSLNEAIQYNPHPTSIVAVLQSKEHLFKELNYHNPTLANKLHGQSATRAVEIWREEMIRGGIQRAVSVTKQYHEERDMQERLLRDPNDVVAVEYFDKKRRQAAVQEQYHQMMEEYPESLGRVLMLYIDAKINGHAIKPFCDSGAQMTIMSKKVCHACGLSDLIDTRFRGIATGVGTGTILGRIHVVQLQIANYYFPCSVTVMDDPAQDGATEMPFLLGLDMMRRHLCQIDLERGVLRFRLSSSASVGNHYMETPFLHEKDLDASQGGTRGFDANRANEEFLALLQKQEQEEEKESASKTKAAGKEEEDAMDL